MRQPHHSWPCAPLYEKIEVAKVNGGATMTEANEPSNDGKVSQQVDKRSSVPWRYASAARAAVSWIASHLVILSTAIVIGIAFLDVS
jgi:hypothetical protein